MTVCYNVISGTVLEVNSSIVQFNNISSYNLTNDTALATLRAINSALMIPYNLYGISFGCYYGALEAFEILLAYGNFV